MFDRSDGVTLVEVRAALERLAAGFDPGLLPAEACARAVADAAAIEKMAATVKSLASAHVAKTDRWRRKGARSAAHDLARSTGTSVREAADAISTGAKLQAMPVLDAAARQGELSPGQAAAIADAASVDPSAEQRLVDKAKFASLAELREECLRTKAAARSGEETHRQIEAGRRLRTFTDGEGAWNLTMRATPEAGAEIMSVLGPLRDRAFDLARREGRAESSEAYAADALVDMARRAAGAAGEMQAPVTPTKVIVRIDWDALVRGWPIGGEVSEIAGVGPVPVSLVQTMIRSGDAFLAAVVTKGADVLNVAHLGRQPTAKQRTGIEWLSPTCTTEGCNTSAHLEIDHRHDWADTKLTLLGWLDRLCTFHHARKTRESWALVDGHGKRPMVPPEDPRHPRNAGAEPPPRFVTSERGRSRGRPRRAAPPAGARRG